MPARPGSRLAIGRVAFVALIGLGGAALFTEAPLAGQQPAEGRPSTAQRVTFTRDIAPILQRSCQNCHRPNSLAPMSLLTYEEARPYAAAIKRRTSIRSKQGTMPPWYIEKDIGIQHYKNDISLSDEEVAKIAAWADNGAPRGNPADMPAPLKFADGERMDDRHAGSRRRDAAGQREGRAARLVGNRRFCRHRAH